VEFPSNSHNPKAEDDGTVPEKKTSPIVSGKVTRRKKPLGVRLREMFFADSEQSVFDYIFGDVLVPAMKDMITDAVSQGVERMVFGETRPNRRRQTSSGAFGGNSNYTNYNNRYSSSQRPTDRPSVNRRARSSHDFDDIILSTRAEAEEVIGTLVDYIGKYEQASVQDLFELVNEPFHHTDSKWGWTNLEMAGIRRVGTNGYMLVLPKTEPID
jgi:hypothetical protein